MTDSRPLRILIYGLNFSPELTGVGKYNGELAGFLSSQGVAIRVVTSYPYYPAWKVQNGYSNYRYNRETTGVKGNNYPVFRCPLWVPRDPTGLKRIIHLFSFSLSSLPVCLAQAFWKPDIIFCVAPTILSAPTALITAWLAGSKSWLHLQDFEISAAWSMGFMKKFQGIHKPVMWLYHQILKGFDRVSTISGRMIKALAAGGLDSGKLYLLPNWVGSEINKPGKNSNGFRNELSLLEKDIVILFSGSMTKKQNLPLVIAAAKQLSGKRNIQFVLCGTGEMRSSLENQASVLQNVHFLDPQPPEKFPYLLNLADIHILPQISAASDLVMPSKITAMLASGKPVIATTAKDTEIGHLLEYAGLVTPPDDASALADAILTLAGSAQLRSKLGKAAQNIAEEQFSSVKVLNNLFESIKNFVTV